MGGRGGDANVPLAGFGRVIARTRYVVLLAVVAVMLVSISLFLLGTVGAVKSVISSWNELATRGEAGSTEQIVESLAIIGVMLRAVVFYLIGVGLYSLFIAPLNLTTALGVESLSDLETKVVSVVVVIMAVSFLQHFVRWEQPYETMLFGLTLAAVVAALVLFQLNSRREREFAKQHNPNVQKRAQAEMFHADKEERTVRADEIEQPAGGGEAQAGREP
jgi:uncharacterized membrane protein YqhA